MSERQQPRPRALRAARPGSYDRVGAVLSFGQDPRWRRALVARVPHDGGTVLDVATGTGLVAERLARPRPSRHRARPEPRHARGGAARASATASSSSRRSATELPFADASFDHLTFTYLLRYVDDPGATLRELARVVRPGGTIASLEFCVPRGIWRPLWDLYVGVGLPAAGRVDLARLVRGRPLPRPVDPRLLRALAARRQLELWRAAGIADVRARRMSLGGGVVIWGVARAAELRPAFYALRQAAGATT